MNLIFCLIALISGPDALTASAELPDPFRFTDGRRVASPEEWPARRGEMLELLLKYEYGHVPPAPGNVALDAVLESGTRSEGASTFQAVRIKFGPKQSLSTTVHLYLPTSASGPMPLVLRFGLGGEHASAANAAGFAFACLDQTSLDPTRRATTKWARRRPPTRTTTGAASPCGRGARAARWIIW